MLSLISEGIEVSVETFYQPDYSNPLQGEYMFAYRITIANHNDFQVQLVSREWNIFESTGEYRSVTGEGVVGVMPVIGSKFVPDQVHTTNHYQYTSGVNLKSDIGRMSGFYHFINKKTGAQMKVKIPAFEMYAPMKLN